MATHDYDIANQSGAAFRTDLNNALAAIQSNNSNSSSPATTVAYQWWADTTNGVLKIRNSSNNDWVELFQLDGTLTLEDGSNSAPALAFRDDLDTGIFSSAANNFDIATGGSVRLNVSSSGINVTGGVTASGTSTFNEDVTFAGANVNITFDKSVDTLSFGDDSKLEFGGGQDLIIQHDTSGTDVNTINSANCDLNILHGTETMISCKDDGQVELYHNGTEAITTGDVFNVIKAASTGNPAGLQIFNTNNGSNFSHAAIKLESKNGASTGHIFADHNNSNLRLGFNTTGATLEIYNDGDIRVQGLRFGSDTADTNTLHDYEEGDFTFHLRSESGTNATMSGRVGRYVKIGQTVHIIGGGQYSGDPDQRSSSHAIEFTNLPFTNVSTGVGSAGFPFPVQTQSLSSTGLASMNGSQPYVFKGRLDNNATSGRIVALKGDGDQNPQNASLACVNNTQIYVMFTYQTTV
tara:strand:+ start:74 stop:1468 length:1395 start_codon:yes stop_codon:yes gene_type:complete